MKLDKVLCCRFLFAILGVDRVRNLAKYNRRLRVFMHLTNKRVSMGLTVSRKTVKHSAVRRKNC